MLQDPVAVCAWSLSVALWPPAEFFLVLVGVSKIYNDGGEDDWIKSDLD